MLDQLTFADFLEHGECERTIFEGIALIAEVRSRAVASRLDMPRARS